MSSTHRLTIMATVHNGLEGIVAAETRLSHVEAAGFACGFRAAALPPHSKMLLHSIAGERVEVMDALRMTVGTLTARDDRGGKTDPAAVGVHRRATLRPPSRINGREVGMFELLALVAVLAVGVLAFGVFIAACMAVKFALKLVLLPVKLLLLPVLAIVVIAKLGVLLAVGLAVVGVVVAVVIPIVIMALFVAVPIALISALT